MDYVNSIPMTSNVFMPISNNGEPKINQREIPKSDILIPPPVFIEANTFEVTKSTLLTKCTIPVFAKDNEATISHNDFIRAVEQVVEGYYSETNTSIRVSHPIKGRIPKARYKKASELQPHEETLYYERMMFVVSVPGVRKDIVGNSLSLTIGGVRSYHLDNLHSKKSAEKFKLFIGFKNKVCSNLCVWSDGLVDDFKAFTVYELQDRVQQMIEDFNPIKQLEEFTAWQNRFITEKQFA